MAITTVDDIVAGLAASTVQRRPILKYGTIVAAGNIYTFAYTAGFPSAMAQPPLNNAGSGYACDSSTAGAVPLTNAAAQLWLTNLMLSCGASGVLVLYDRLWASSFAAPTGAGTVSFTTPGSLPARITDSGVGVEAWLDSYSAGGASAGTLALNYLDTAGASKTGATFTPGNTPTINRSQPIPLAAGSRGISQVTSLSNSATMTSGTYALVLRKRIAEIPIVASSTPAADLDWASLGLPKIPNGACLEVMLFAAAATTPILIGTAVIIDK